MLCTNGDNARCLAVDGESVESKSKRASLLTLAMRMTGVRCAASPWARCPPAAPPARSVHYAPLQPPHGRR
ncbi:unnamed protein product [Euphydryas editha]|uniref:Uncharacterized protein n=1 Tax=Euphydryas editha TaxID=104508 RepID=A0AAU9U0V7_EUPED|nr:unnamed protein product [Euphydryas editha]